MAIVAMALASKQDSVGASQRVYAGILADLDERRMAPGQRLVEGDLAARFGVGRNAVREALQRLSARGVVDLSPFRGAAIRRVEAAEALEVLEVADAVTSLAFRTAAGRFDPALHGAMLAAAIADLDAAQASGGEAAPFGRARRSFYRTMLEIAANRELQRLFPAIGMHIVYLQYQSPRLQRARLENYRAICSAVAARDLAAVEQQGRAHVDQVRENILALAGTR
ncbi:MAG: hypothetical protein QOD42_1090 [Sphingomonadales bacterium]|jgi:DNA-binding GntR family transcriptional regulator|nr:hypothetical protein [Sphingomonadales bacterium]